MHVAWDSRYYADLGYPGRQDAFGADNRQGHLLAPVPHENEPYLPESYLVSPRLWTCLPCMSWPEQVDDRLGAAVVLLELHRTCCWSGDPVDGPSPIVPGSRSYRRILYRPSHLLLSRKRSLFGGSAVMPFASSGFPPVADDAKPESTPHAACAAHLETSAAEPFFGGEENRFRLGNISITYEFPFLLLPAIFTTHDLPCAHSRCPMIFVCI